MTVAVFSHSSRASAAKKWVAIGLLLLMVLLTARLGVWQLDRAQHKRELADARLAAEAMGLSQLDRISLDGLAAHEGRRFRLRLSQDLPTWYLDNRSHQGQAGMYVFNVLTVEAEEDSVKGHALLLRGWQAKDPRQPQGIQDRGKIMSGWVTVRIEPEREHASSRLGLGHRVAGEHLQHWLAVDSKVMSEKSGFRLAPYVLRQIGPTEDDDGQPTADGLIRQWPEPADGVQKHQAYALQWFLFCGLALFLAGALAVRWRS